MTNEDWHTACGTTDRANRLRQRAVKVVLGPTLQLLGNRTQDHGAPPNRRAKLTAMPGQPSTTPEICDRPVKRPSPYDEGLHRQSTLGCRTRSKGRFACEKR